MTGYQRSDFEPPTDILRRLRVRCRRTIIRNRRVMPTLTLEGLAGLLFR